MICLNIPLFIVGSFLILTLVVGIYFSRKKTTFREHAVGNKQFSTATLVATVLATAYSGGGLLRTVESVYSLGLWWIAITLITCFDTYIIGKLASRMGPFMKHLSMAETIGSIYGKYPRIIVAFVSVCGSILAITMQITAMSKAINMCIDTVDPRIAAMISTSVLVFYSTFGGVRSVTYTDVLQFITFSVIIPLLAWFMFIKIGKSTGAIISSLQDPRFQFSSLFGCSKKLMSMLLLILSFLVARMYPSIIQRVYMTSGPLHAQKVFTYVALCSAIIWSFIILVAIFAFVGEPNLDIPEIWGYIVNSVPPIFKVFLSVSILAMAMSTADSNLNTSAVMAIHDILEHIRGSKNIAQVNQLKLAKWATLVVGLLAMLLSFKCDNLLTLMFWTLDLYVPIVIAPFILAVFGFRGSSRTALIGMAAGSLAIFAWNRVESTKDMDGSFISMLVNGLAMMLAHYLLKQPERASWVGPDDTFKQVQQEKARKRAERKEAVKNSWANRTFTLAQLRPSHTTMVYVGLYLTFTSLLTYFITPTATNSCWITLHLFVAAFFLGHPFLYDISKKIRAIPKWCISLCWLAWLAVYFPISLLWNWWLLLDPIFATCLSLIHCVIILWVLPLYLAIGVVAATSLAVIYPIAIGLSFSALSSLLPLFVVSLLIFTMAIWFKVKVSKLTTQILYLNNREKIRNNQKLKASLYEAALVPINGVNCPNPRGYGFILNQVVHKVEESISFLDNHMPLYKQDLDSIINKFYDWILYFNRREKAKDHALLQPTKITFDKLMRRVEAALSQEVADPPRLLIEKISDPTRGPCAHMVCDIDQVVYSLVKAILRVGKLKGPNVTMVSIQLHPTSLQFKQADAIDNSCPAFMVFPATALVISQSTTDAKELPKVKECYDEIDPMYYSPGKKDRPPSIDVAQDAIASMVRAHYGYLEYPVDGKQPTMLLVLPNEVSKILSKITIKLPIDALTEEALVTPKEQADSMMELMQFYDYVCKYSCQEDPIDVQTISGLLLLLRQHFGFRRHESGQLFYVRAVGIAQLVVEWVFHSPKVIYATLLYGLVRRTCLPLSYVKKHYNLGVYAFVLKMVGIDKRQKLEHPSLLCVQNRLKEAIREDHVQLSVLFIKLAERLYDLRHAAGYSHLTEVQHMAQETLAIDVPLAHAYLEPEIGAALENAAKEALKICKNERKNQKKEKDS